MPHLKELNKWKKNPIGTNHLASKQYVDQQIGKMFASNNPVRKPKYVKQQQFHPYQYL